MCIFEQVERKRFLTSTIIMNLSYTTVLWGVLFLISALPLRLAAQPMQVANGGPFTPENLINNIFLGEGVEVLGITFNGNPQSVGFFNQGDDALGIGRGIVMTTGRVTSQNGVGVDQPGSVQSSTNMGVSLNDPDLFAITGGVLLNDLVRYTITFVPTSDTLRFNYVFASEEYPEYVCSGFNDVFGFFISGPGINGPYTNSAENIALVPGTNLPVAINNVNPGQPGGFGTISNCQPPLGSLAYSQFFNNNDNSGSQPVFDGLTDVFTAEAIVRPCSTYTIKIVIADVGDAGWDSGVFLEAKSFGTGSLDVEASTVSLDGSVVEGCTAGYLNFSLPTRAESDYFIDYTLFGTAINGVDYEFVPPDLFIPAGDSLLVVPIVALEDSLAEGVETLFIDVQRDPCNRDTIAVFIRDNILIPPELMAPDSICPLDSVQLQGRLPVPIPDAPTFTSNQPILIPDIPPNISLFSDIEVSGVQPASLQPGVIQSVCIDSLDHRWIDDLNIYLVAPDGQFLQLSTKNGGDGGNGLGLDYMINTCFTPTAVTPISSVQPTDAPFTGEWQPEGPWSDLYGTDRRTNGTWRLQVIDDTYGLGGNLYSWTITFNPIYDIQYTWSPADGLSCADCPDPVASPGQSTVYTLTATDSYGCSLEDSISVATLPAPLPPEPICSAVTGSSVSIVWPDVGGATGYEINVDSAGWIPPSGPNSHTVSNLTFSTEVPIELRALGECASAIATIVCTTLDCMPPTLDSVEIGDASCPGSADGSLRLFPSGGVPPYRYALGSAEDATGLFTGLTAGEYQVSVVDSVDCGTSFILTIGQPDTLMAELAVQPISCAGEEDGRAALAITNNTGPYRFEWGDGSTDSLRTGLSPGDYFLQVQDSSNCLFSYAFTLAAPDSLSAAATVTDISCADGADGSVNLSIQGGTAPYALAYSAGLAPGTDSTRLTEVPPGDYSATVTDANGCTFDLPFSLAEPPPLSLDFSTVDALCAGSLDGRIAALPGGGSGGFDYEWTDSAGQPLGTDSTLAGLGAGTYELLLTDANGCELRDSVVIAQPDSLAYTLDLAMASCAGLADGSISLTVSGGTGAYSYNWSDIGEGPAERSALTPGNYSLTITDGNACERALAVEITAPQTLQLSLSVLPENCQGSADGQASVVVEGGSPPYSYLWEDGQTDSLALGLAAGTIGLVVTDANGCEGTASAVIDTAAAIVLSLEIEPPSCFGQADGRISAAASGGAGSFSYAWSDGQEMPTAENLSAGNYGLTVTDANGCTRAESFALEQPDALALSLSSETASCLPVPDGSALASASGGTPPYTYAWSNGESLPNAQGLAGGLYRLTLTDANGCELVDSVLVDSLPSLMLSLSSEPASCFGAADGALSALVEGGSGSYTYSWSGGLAAQASVGNLAAGTYSLTVTDSLGCEAVGSIAVTQPTAINLSAEVDMISCAGAVDGRISLSLSGGTSPYGITWNTGATGPVLQNLGMGSYTAEVVDAVGCSGSTTVEITEASPMSISLVTEAALCYEQRSGSARASVSGGRPPYTYLWSNGATGPSIGSLLAGSYTVSVIDASGCAIERSFDIRQPDPLRALATALDISCHGLGDGRIDVEATGGQPGYRYSLDGDFFSGSPSFIGLPQGDYQVLVQDGNGCTSLSDEVTVSEPPPLVVSLGDTRAIPYGDTVRLQPSITGGNPPFGYEWITQDTSILSCLRCSAPLVSVQFQHSIKVIVTDIDGCTGEDVFNIYANKERPVFVPTGFTPNGDGRNDILFVLSREGLQAEINTFRIFDRWGEQVFERKDLQPNEPADGWDGSFRGQLLQPGVYLWQVELTYPDGLRDAFQGHTNLIR